MEQICIEYNQENKKKKTYTVLEIAVILGISQRSAYRLCNTTQEFKVLFLGRSIRVLKESFDNWLSS